MYKRVHIYDLDGVLVDSSHRYRTLADGSIDMPYWKRNHNEKQMRMDKVLPMARRYMFDCLSETTYCVICSVRSMSALDIAWIFSHLGAPDKLLLIGQTKPPYTPDYILKVRTLQRFLHLKQFRGLHKRFWDDNLRTVYAVADLGIESNFVLSNQGRSDYV